MSHRAEQLLALTDAFLDMHRAWVDDPNRTAPDAIYWDSVDSVLEAFDVGDVPAECRELADAVEAFGDEVYQFDAREDVGRTMPHNSFWTAREAVERARAGAAKQERIPLEPISVLRQQQVPDWQIAMIYGLVPRHHIDRPNLYAHLIQKELDNPGSVIGPDWTDPRDRDEAETIEKTDRRHNALMDKKRASAKTAEPEVCPETIEELLQQGVSVEQIAKMKDVPMTEVVEMQQLMLEKQAA